MKRIAVLLTCHNRKEKTINCLKSLHQGIEICKHELEFDIFLVDDGSTDGTSSTVLEHYPKTNIIQGDGHLYWNRGMNLAWETAAKKEYDFYLWLNDDNILLSDSIKTLFNDSELKKNKSVIVGVCRSKEGSVSYSGYNNLKEERKLDPVGMPIRCDYFNGNVVLIPSNVFKKVGYLDPVFHHGKGDFEYGLRAKKMGITSYVSSISVSQCEPHNDLPIWCNPKYPLSKRLKSFKSPLGGNPRSTFIFQRKYLGLRLAVLHYITIHLRLLYPKLWR